MSHGSDAGRRGVLHIPSEAPMLATVRVFIAAFLAGSADDETIEDLKLVVGEASSMMRPGGVAIAIAIDEERAHVTCEGVEAPGDDEAGSMRARVIEALVPDVAWAEGAVRFSLPLSVETPTT